jgi:transposase-like protein
MTHARAFRGFRFPAEVILWAVRWYLQFPISCRDLEAMLADRGVEVDHTTVHRWVQRFAPELEKRMRRHLQPCRGPWHVDETYLRVGGQWRYLYRAVDGTGQTIDFLLSAMRDKAATRRFFRKALGRGNTRYPRTVVTDRLKSYPARSGRRSATGSSGASPGTGAAAGSTTWSSKTIAASSAERRRCSASRAFGPPGGPWPGWRRWRCWPRTSTPRARQRGAGAAGLRP